MDIILGHLSWFVLRKSCKIFCPILWSETNTTPLAIKHDKPSNGQDVTLFGRHPSCFRDAFKKKKRNILWQCANFNCYLPTLPNCDKKIYDKLVIFWAPTHLQVFMTKCEFELVPYNFTFYCSKGKSLLGHSEFPWNSNT